MLSYLIPQILTVGDMQHLLACPLPRRVLVVNPVDGRRRRLPAGELVHQFIFSKRISALTARPASFQAQTAAADDVPALLARWLQQRN